MRTLAMIGAVSIAALIAANGAWAWSQEQTAQGSPNGTAVDLSDPENFQALQDKVNGKTQSQSGFQVYSGVGAGPGSLLAGAGPYGVTPLAAGDRLSAIRKSGLPGERELADPAFAAPRPASVWVQVTSLPQPAYSTAVKDTSLDVAMPRPCGWVARSGLSSR